jgi:hypothetical protein
VVRPEILRGEGGDLNERELEIWRGIEKGGGAGDLEGGENANLEGKDAGDLEGVKGGAGDLEGRELGVGDLELKVA